MNKRGQFFLIMTIMIIGLISSIATVTNSASKKSDPRFGYVGDELKFESERVIDYSLNTHGNMKENLTAFAKNYSTYSNADNFYYVFGNTTAGIKFVGLQKNKGGVVNVNFGGVGSGDVVLTPGNFAMASITNPSTSGNMTINGTKYSFALNSGQNFYFVVSKEIDGDVRVATNG